MPAPDFAGKARPCLGLCDRACHAFKELLGGLNYPPLLVASKVACLQHTHRILGKPRCLLPHRGIWLQADFRVKNRYPIASAS